MIHSKRLQIDAARELLDRVRELNIS